MYFQLKHLSQYYASSCIIYEDSAPSMDEIKIGLPSHAFQSYLDTRIISTVTSVLSDTLKSVWWKYTRSALLTDEIINKGELLLLARISYTRQLMWICAETYIHEVIPAGSVIWPFVTLQHELLKKKHCYKLNAALNLKIAQLWNVVSNQRKTTNKMQGLGPDGSCYWCKCVSLISYQAI